ncbi:MAG TPA: TAT-variant-translocated molybdopterin oxidoreductase [Polyangiaceae bacterium]|jgi:molybdopterin-containing oxidoreductase family iron-sulfur binding subunit|nr:TAT-variant-translocated molybdopterin oxidoreductase [Polyangiaceae bacterium]
MSSIDKKKRLSILGSASAASTSGSTGDVARPTYWKSLAELENSAEFREFATREFAAPLEQEPPNSPGRRRFMQIMGASMSLAGLDACRWREDKILPQSRRPEGTIPGNSKFFATAYELNGNAVGLHAASYDGRPIKLEGNPVHPDSLGATSAYQQATLLELYDPDRSDSVVTRAGGARKPSSWEEFGKASAELLKAAQANGGAALRILSGRSSSPTLAEQKKKLGATFPQAKWVTFEPIAYDGARAGSVLAFGKAYRTHYAFEGAQVILTLDADVVHPTFPSGLANARAITKNRVPDGGHMSRVYAIESAVTLTGGISDHRLALRSGAIKAVAALLDANISAKARPLPELGAAQDKPPAEFLKDEKVAKFLDALSADLLANIGSSVVVPGEHQPAEVHAIAHRLNALLGNVNRTVFYTEDTDASETSDVAALKALTDELNAGKVDTLIILEGNPVFTAPADLAFGDALAKAKNSIHLSLYEDETSERSSWHLPAAHYLESWGDARGWDGTISIVQPLIEPLHGGKSALELVAQLNGVTGSALDWVRATHPSITAEHAWRNTLAAGVIAGSSNVRAQPTLKPLGKVALGENELTGVGGGNGKLELVFAIDPKIVDGRYANNAWLQELPESMTKLTWDNAVFVSPRTAKELGLEDGDSVTLSVGSRQVTLLALIAPGHADGSLKITLGHGRTSAGHVGGLVSDNVDPVGGNAYAVRTLENYEIANGVSVKSNGLVPYRVPTTQDVYTVGSIGQAGTQERLPELVREGTLEKLKNEPNFVKEIVEHNPLLSLWVPPVSYEGHKWGMAIDLNKCIGCSACVTACQAENNIPVVGKTNVAMGREMLWLRVDRYYRGTPEDAEVSFQPIPCQQCENAPCEQVCPVGATMHSREGLNEMTYNRCIGTRYCSNNCPYKVRRFNFFNYNLDTIGITPYTPTDDPKAKVKAMVFNPEVTVRSRGVMEKCTFCVQRIQNVKIKAKNVKRTIEDGEIRTACQQTCPADAIVFGDLNDPKARVTAQQALPRSYGLLEDLNNRPRVRYLARIKNPNPALAPKEAEGTKAEQG